jgi:predicted ATPase
VALGARAFDLLLALIEHRARVVGKDELLSLVWPDVVVEEGNLAVQVSALRKLLGSDVISTIPGRGYRFTARVTDGPSDGWTPVLEAGGGHRVLDATSPLPALPQAAYEELMHKLRRPPDAAAPADGIVEFAVGRVPAAMAPLVGRAAALDETQQLLQATRCLTLTGAGGAGKTRLALALAEAVRTQYPGGVWWVELDRLSDPRMLAAAVAQGLGVPDSQQPALQAMALHLKGRKALLVLDNCEHLVDGCAELAAQLLRELPLLQVLATSRESLRIAGEVAWSVPPLEVPASEAGVRLDELLQTSSVQLLVQRIGQHDPAFTPTQDKATSLVRICRGLEGLPLALELVAAQVGTQTLAQVASRLDRSLLLLNVGQRGGVRHHQTMSAAVDWGFRLLGEAESALFLSLSVFAGGWTLEGAEALSKGLDIVVEDVPAVLGRLHRVSMVLAQEADGALRFRMLEPIRQFAFARLEELGQAARVKRQLLAWYVDRCKAVAAQLAGPQQALGYRFLTSEFDNLRALLSWSKQEDLENGLRLAADLWRFWQVKGHAKEMLAWFDEALPLASGVPRALQADAFNAAGVMARTCGRYAEAVRLHDTALGLQRETGNRRGEAIALNNLCVVARDQYDHAAVERYGRASLQIAREIGERNLEGLGLMHLGTALRGQNRVEDAETSFRQSFEIFSELGERRALAALLNYLGNLAQAGGRWPEAARCFDESLELNRALGDFWGLGISTFNQASLHFAREDHAAALPLLMQSFAHYRRAGAKHGVEECFELLAHIAQKRGSPERAAWCWGVVEQLEQDMGKVLPPDLKPRREQVMFDLERQMTPEVFGAARETGRRELLEDALQAVLPDGGLA